MNKQASPKEDRSKTSIQSFVESLFDINNCPLCRTLYDLNDHTPKIIPFCGHTFCISCLERFLFTSSLKCPMCQSITRYLKNIDSLPTNHLIYTNIIETMPKEMIHPGRDALQLPGQTQETKEGNIYQNSI